MLDDKEDRAIPTLLFKMAANPRKTRRLGVVGAQREMGQQRTAGMFWADVRLPWAGPCRHCLRCLLFSVSPPEGAVGLGQQ